MYQDYYYCQPQYQYQHPYQYQYDSNYQYHYLQWLQNCVQIQDSRILELENLVKKLSDELKQLKEKPAIHVDTISYNFDQLKVETVEGTLNIGLSPSDLQGVEDLAINNSETPQPASPKSLMQRSIEIEDAILQFLETDLPSIVEGTQNQLRIQPNDAYLSFIKEDIKKQIPGRIDFHLKSFAMNNPSGIHVNEANEKIINLLKQEIQNGVAVFFNHLPENMKGMMQE